MLSDLQKMLLIISTPLCGIGCLICLIRMMTTTNDYAIRLCKTTLFRIVIAWVALNGFAMIIHAVEGLIGDNINVSYTIVTK